MTCPKNERTLSHQSPYYVIEIPKPIDLRGEYVSKYMRKCSMYVEVYVNLPYNEKTFYIYVGESEEKASDFIKYLMLMKGKGIDEVRNIIEKYSGEMAGQVISHFGKKLREIAALMLWADARFSAKYGEPELGMVLDSLTNEPLFLVLTFPNCSSDEWDRLITLVKDTLRSSGLEELTGMVAVVCAEGLKEELTS